MDSRTRSSTCIRVPFSNQFFFCSPQLWLNNVSACVNNDSKDLLQCISEQEPSFSNFRNGLCTLATLEGVRCCNWMEVSPQRSLEVFQVYTFSLFSGLDSRNRRVRPSTFITDRLPIFGREHRFVETRAGSLFIFTTSRLNSQHFNRFRPFIDFLC
jgi:hypothetical protein